MSIQPDRLELVRRALDNARRIAERLRRHEKDLAHKMPGEAQGGEALCNAATAAERVARLLEASHIAAGTSKPNP